MQSEKCLMVLGVSLKRWSFSPQAIYCKRVYCNNALWRVLLKHHHRHHHHPVKKPARKQNRSTFPKHAQFHMKKFSGPLSSTKVKSAARKLLGFHPIFGNFDSTNIDLSSLIKWILTQFLLKRFSESQGKILPDITLFSWS